MKIGVISDTHNFLDSRLPGLLNGVHHILHGGDVGTGSIILRLEKIAPVTVVLGNTDDPSFGYKITETLELNGVGFLLHHIVNPYSLSDTLQNALCRFQPHVVIFGHTHKYFCQTIDNVLFFNPGYAGKNRFGMERSVAILHLESSGIRPERIPLPSFD